MPEIRRRYKQETAIDSTHAQICRTPLSQHADRELEPYLQKTSSVHKPAVYRSQTQVKVGGGRTV
jgi:hypothetical protein